MLASRVAPRALRCRPIVSLLCAPLLLRASVTAQEPPPDTLRAHWLDTIVVTAQRIETPLAQTPAAVSVIEEPQEAVPRASKDCRWLAYS